MSKQFKTRVVQFLKGLVGRADRYPDNEKTIHGDEYSLLVKNKRIVDYSKVKERYGLKLKIGLYKDTYKHLADGLQKEIALNNINTVLSAVAPYYKKLVKERFAQMQEENRLSHSYSPKFEHVRKLFKVTKLRLLDNAREDIFCINLFERPDREPFIVIGNCSI